MARLVKIGTGAFSTAYRLNKDKVLLTSIDPIKECMALGMFPNSRLFPKIRFGDNRNEYIMKYYTTVTAPKQQLNAQSYELYKQLRKVLSGKYHSFVHSVESYVKCKNTREILIQAFWACKNYADHVGFEISPRNIAATPQGYLVLRDCFFDVDLCRDMWTGKLKRPTLGG